MVMMIISLILSMVLVIYSLYFMSSGGLQKELDKQLSKKIPHDYLILRIKVCAFGPMIEDDFKESLTAGVRHYYAVARADTEISSENLYIFPNNTNLDHLIEECQSNNFSLYMYHCYHESSIMFELEGIYNYIRRSWDKLNKKKERC